MAQSFEEQVSEFTLLQSKEVQAELGIDEAMRGKMNKFAEDFNTKANALQVEYRKQAEGKNPPPPEPIQKLQQLELNLRKNVYSLMSKAQLKRLSELTLQTAGYPAMMNPTVAKRIGLTDAQLKRLRDAYQKTGEAVNKLQQVAVKPIYEKYGKVQPKDEAEKNATQEKINAETKAAMDKITPELKKLRDEWLLVMKKTVKAIQLNRFEALQGKPFKPK
ncbi:MAG: hypothetical protein ACKVQS_08850 [Fimbriimonadaceae bacterium]